MSQGAPPAKLRRRGRLDAPLLRVAHRPASTINMACFLAHHAHLMPPLGNGALRCDSGLTLTQSTGYMCERSGWISGKLRQLPAVALSAKVIPVESNEVIVRALSARKELHLQMTQHSAAITVTKTLAM